MTKLYWKVRIFFLALRWIPQVNLGDKVRYQGKIFSVSNGNRAASWRLGGLDNGRDGWVPRNECKKVWTFANVRWSFLAGWRFYMTSWFDIWCREGIKGWMRGCNIWPWPHRR